MSYFIKYQLSFVSDRNNIYDLHILQKNYGGQPILKKLGTAPMLSIEEGEGRVKGSSLSFSIQADVEGELKGLYTTNNKEFKVLLYRNSSLYWQGFLLPELYSENYIDPPYDVAVTATDQLGVLKNIQYNQERGNKSLLEIITYILTLTQLDLKIVQHLNLTISGNERFLSGAYVSTEGYYGQSCYDVLNSILLSCNTCIQQYENEWVIMSLTDATTAFVKDGAVVNISHVQLGQMGNAQVYPDGSLEMVNKPALKGVSLNYAHILKNSFLKNADCESKDGWQYSFESTDNRFPGTVDEFGVLYKCNCWQLPQKDVAVNGALQLWQDVNIKADNTYNCQLSVDYRMDLGASLLLMAIIHEGADGVTRRLTSEGWKEGGSATDKNSYINVTGTPSELWLTWAKDISDFSKYEKATVQFQLPAVDGVLRIGFINTTDTGYVNPLSGHIYLTKVYLTYMGIAGKASTTVVEGDATNAQEEISLAYGERVPATNEALAVLNTLRSSNGIPMEQFSLNSTSGVKSYDSYFLAMLQEMSRYYAVKKMQLQGSVMGVSPLYLLYADVFSGKIMRLVSGEYDLLQDSVGILLEEVPDAWVDYETEVFATDNSVPGTSSSGVVTVGGGSGASLLAVNAKGEVYVKDDRVLSGVEADFSRVVLPDKKPAGSADKAYIYSQAPKIGEILDANAVNMQLVIDELVGLRDDFDALSDLLNDDVAGVINTWDEVVDFLNEYSESQDLASILSQMNADIANRVFIEDFEKLEEAVNPLFGYFDANGNANNALKLGGHSVDYFATADALNTHIKDFNTYKTTTDNRLNKLEDLWYMDKDGNVHTTHNIIVEGGGAFGMGAESGGDVGGLGKVTIYLEGSNIPYETNLNGEVTIPAYPTALKNPYALTINGHTYDGSEAVNITISGGGGVADSVDWVNVYNKPTTLGGYGITDALSTSGGVITGKGYDILTINRIDNRPTLAFAYNGTTVGYLGMTTGGVPMYVSSAGDAYSLYHSGNFNPADYLPLSGGIMRGAITLHSLRFIDKSLGGIDANNADIINLNAIYTADSAQSASEGIHFARDNGNWDTLSAYEGVLYYYPNRETFAESWSNAYKIIHSGNIGDYALKTDGSNNISKYITIDTDLTQILYLRSSSGGSRGELGADTNTGELIWRNLFKGESWRYVAFADSNVASATKLQTGRYLWGNYFNGESDVNGKPLFRVANADIPIDVNRASIIVGPATLSRKGYSSGVGFNGLLGYGGYDNHLHGWIGLNGWYSGDEAETYALVFAVNDNTTYGSVLTERMRITPNGNVGIGTSTPQYKLDVNGKIRFEARTIWGQLFDGTGDIINPAIMQHLIFSDSNGEETGYVGRGGADDTLYFRSYKNAPIHIGRNNYTDVIIKDGNVLIGTYDDSGNKLQVNGRSYIGNSEVWRHVIRSGNSSQSAEVYTLKVIQGSDCGSGLYDTMIITSSDVATLRISESDGTQMGICAGDGHGTFTSTHDFRFFTGVATNQPVYSGGGGGFKVGINYEGAALYVSGNLTVTGGGAFGSDIRYKDIIAYQQLDLETIVNAPLFTFKWTDREDKVEHLGTSAQYWLDTQFKDAVNTANKDFFHLDYGALAVGIGISVAREVKGVKTEVEVLRERVNQLEKELAQYRRA